MQSSCYSSALLNFLLCKSKPKRHPAPLPLVGQSYVRQVLGVLHAYVHILSLHMSTYCPCSVLSLRMPTYCPCYVHTLSLLNIVPAYVHDSAYRS